MHVDVTYDLEIDTHQLSAEENIAKIKSFTSCSIKSGKPPDQALSTKKDACTLRNMREEDLPSLIKTFCFPWTSEESTNEKWNRYYLEQQNCIRTVCLLERQNQLIGYGNLLRASEYPAFKKNNIPEINDVWLKQELIPTLIPGQVIILDNASFHKSAETRRLVEEAGCKILFLPPYSPDLNPIEKYWANMKTKVRELLPKVQTFTHALDQAILSM